MEEEQILDLTPITPLVGEPNSSPQQSSLKKFSDYFKDIKQDDKPIIGISESDLGKFRGKFLPTASLNRLLKGDETLETEFALTQSVGERMVNSMKISGANILATSLGLLAEIPDMISTGEIIGENAPIAKGLFDWRNEVQKNNTPYETYYDKENPFKSILLPGFLTGSSKGWGTIVENASYGIGAGIGIAAEEAMFTALTGGIGSIPVLAKSLAKLIKLSKNTKDLAKYIEQGGTALKSIDNALDVSEEALKLAKKEKFFADVLEGTKDVYRTTAMSYSEAQMEALEGKNNYIEQQKLNFRKTFGYDATGRELEEINKKSSDVYTARFTANMALLGASNYVSNRVFFGGLDKLKDSLNKFKNEGIEGTIDQLGNLSFADDAFKLKTNSKWWEKGFGKGVKKGVEFGVNTIKNVPLALSEGVEEGGQFIIDKATNNYFAFDNKKDKQDLLTSITNATKDLFTTTEGQQSMLLGMLGGSGQQIVGNITQSIGDKALIGTEGYVPLKERKALKIKQLNDFASQYNTPEVGAVNVNSVFGTLDKKFKNTSKLLAASGALDEVLGNKELERRVEENISFNTLAPFVEMGMGDVAKEMFKYRIDSLTDEEWTSTGIKKSKNEIMSDFSTKIKTVEEAFDMSNKKFINPYTKNTEDYDRFEDVKNNYAYTLYQIQRDVKEADKIKQTHNKYFDVLKNFANASTLKDGRQYINNKIKENKDRIALLEQAESTQFTKDELKKAKLVLKNYEEIKSKLSPIGMKKEQYSKMLDKLIFTTNYEYSFPEDVLDKEETIEAIQNYLDIQTRIKSNLEDVKLIQGGSWEENKKFILKKKKEAEVLKEKKEEIETKKEENVITEIENKIKNKKTLTEKEQEIIDKKNQETSIPVISKEEERINSYNEVLSDIKNIKNSEEILKNNLLEKFKQGLQKIKEDKSLVTKKQFIERITKLINSILEEDKKSKRPKAKDLLGRVVYYLGKPYTLTKEGNVVVLESSSQILELGITEEDFIEDFNIKTYEFREEVKKYKVEIIDENETVVNNVLYKINTDGKGNIISLSPQSNLEQEIKNEKLIIAVEIERNKTDFIILSEATINENYEELKKDNYSLLQVERIYSKNYTEQIDNALEKLYNGEKLTGVEELGVDLWVTDAIIEATKLYNRFPKNEVFSNMLDNLEIINILLYTKNYKEYEKPKEVSVANTSKTPVRKVETKRVEKIIPEKVITETVIIKDVIPEQVVVSFEELIQNELLEVPKKIEIVQTQPTPDKAETINKEREDNFEYALEEVGEKRISDFNQILDGGKLQQEFFSSIAKEVRGNKKLQTKEDFVQALNEFIDEYFKELDTAEETPVTLIPVPVVNKLPSFPASKNKVAYMVGQENTTPVGMNYKKAMQEAIVSDEFILQVGEERPATINTKDEVLIIEGSVEKPILFNGEEIGTIAPSGTYKIKPEFENTEIALKLTPYIEIKNELYNAKEIRASYKATDFNTSVENYQDVLLNNSRFTKFLYFSKRLGKNVLMDRVVIEQYEENGKQKYDFIDSLSYDGLSDKKDRDLLREELIEVFEKSGSRYKKENQYFVFMIGRSEEKGQFLNIQPINIPNKTKTATEEIEAFFDVEDAELLQKKLLYDENKPADMKGWNDEYRLIDKSKYTDALRNVGTPEKTPNIKIFVNKNAQNKVDSLSLQIEGQKVKSWKIVKVEGGYKYGTNQAVFESIYDIIKDISPNYEIRTAKLAGQEREHGWALQNFRIGEQVGKVYNQQQFILSPLDKPKENSEIIELNKFEMKEEKIVPEQIIVRESDTEEEKRRDIEKRRQEELSKNTKEYHFNRIIKQIPKDNWGKYYPNTVELLELNWFSSYIEPGLQGEIKYYIKDNDLLIKDINKKYDEELKSLNNKQELSSIILITDVDNFVKKEFTPEVIEMIYNKLKDGKQKDVITPIYESYLNGELEPMEKYLSDPKRMNSILKLNLPLKDIEQAQLRNVNSEIQNKLNEYLNNCK